MTPTALTIVPIIRLMYRIEHCESMYAHHRDRYREMKLQCFTLRSFPFIFSRSKVDKKSHSRWKAATRYLSLMRLVKSSLNVSLFLQLRLTYSVEILHGSSPPRLQPVDQTSSLFASTANGNRCLGSKSRSREKTELLLWQRQLGPLEGFSISPTRLDETTLRSAF